MKYLRCPECHGTELRTEWTGREWGYCTPELDSGGELYFEDHIPEESLDVEETIMVCLDCGHSSALFSRFIYDDECDQVDNMVEIPNFED